MSAKGSYEYPAWCQMETSLDCYQQDRQAYLDREASKLGPDGKQQLGRFNEAADSLVKGVQNLAGLNGVACPTELVKSGDFQREKPFELLDEHVCITFGWEALTILSDARERFLHLLLLLKDRQPCDRAMAFLQRVARCYLFGFDNECVVMCRAVLDQEFGEQIIDDDQVSEWWKWYATTPEGGKYRGKKPPYGSLWARIPAAKHAGIIEEGDRDAADAVRNRGNDAVHKKPDTGEALETVRQTVQVLDALTRDA